MTPEPRERRPDRPDCDDLEVTLREYLERRIDDLRERLDERALAQERSLQVTAAQIEARFTSVNEFRAALADQAQTFMPRKEFTVMHQRLEERLDESRREHEKYELKSSADEIHKRNTGRIDDLTDRINVAEGKGLGLHAGWVYLLGGIAAVGSLVSMVSLFFHIR